MGTAARVQISDKTIYFLLSTEWNDEIVALEKTTWFHFHLMKTGFLFLLETIY